MFNDDEKHVIVFAICCLCMLLVGGCTVTPVPDEPTPTPTVVSPISPVVTPTMPPLVTVPAAPYERHPDIWIQASNIVSFTMVVVWGEYTPEADPNVMPPEQVAVFLQYRLWGRSWVKNEAGDIVWSGEVETGTSPYARENGLPGVGDRFIDIVFEVDSATFKGGELFSFWGIAEWRVPENDQGLETIQTEPAEGEIVDDAGRVLIGYFYGSQWHKYYLPLGFRREAK